MFLFKYNDLLIRLIFLLVLSIFSVRISVADELPMQPPDHIDYPTDPATVIIDYQRDHPMLADKKGAGSIKVYGAGRNIIDFPEYMKNSGTYEIYLSDAEIQVLLQRLTNNGHIGAPEQVPKGNAKAETQTSSDHSSSKLNLHLSTTAAQSSAEVFSNDINEHPALSTPGIDTEIEKPLIEILQRNDMIPINR